MLKLHCIINKRELYILVFLIYWHSPRKKLWLNFSSVMMTIIVTNFIEYIIKVFSKMGGVKYN